ncbi:MAG: hypothetical protein KGK09_16640 [Burkholderiales bacterium]|nr:hypothetical protein [Burkholderiales bacterium]
MKSRSPRTAGVTLALALALALTLAGCAGQPTGGGAAAARFEAVTPATAFTGLRAISEQRAKAAHWNIGGWSEMNGVPLLATDTYQPDDAVTGQADFMQWCRVRGGVADAATAQAARAVLAGRQLGDAPPDAVGCTIGGQPYAFAKTYWMHTLAQYWLDPALLATAPAMAATRARADAQARQAAAAQAAEALRQRTAFLEHSPPGTTLACAGYVLAQGLSAPITRIPLDCDGLRSNLPELVGKGWQVMMQTARPDGDFGGVARTRYDLLLRKG